MIKMKIFTIFSDEYNQFVNITPKVSEIVRQSEIKNGMVFVVSRHTTTGILVNEGLECLEEDRQKVMQPIRIRLVAEE